MAEEDNTDDVADEMMRMMAEEAGGSEEGEAAEPAEAAEGGESAEGGDEAAAAGDDDFEEQMLKAMQDEMAGGGGDEAESTGEGDGESQMIEALAAETGTSPEATSAAIQHLGGLPAGVSASPGSIARVLGVKLSVSIELGQTEENISTLLHWTEGSLIELDKVSGEPVDVIVNNKPYARGEVVVIAENFGVRLTEISPAPSRSAL